MYPTEERINGLRERFGVSQGQIFTSYKYKNLNWYYCTDPHQPVEKDEWFCYGDIQPEDPHRLMNLLRGNEYLVLGWKELGPNQKFEQFFRDGGGLWMIISRLSVVDAHELMGQIRRWA